MSREAQPGIGRNDSAPLTIGALSRATGVSVETLRTWERRYGVPEPFRTSSGHRRYPLETVNLLKKVVAALERGHRASVVLTCSPQDLDSLLKLPFTPSSPNHSALETPSANPERLTWWLAELQRMDGPALDHAFHSAWKDYGAEAFVLELAAPFIREVGERWACRQLSVAHEHFASGRLEDFLIQRWSPMSAAAPGASIVLTTLPGEEHSLPLHLGATLIVQDGFRPRVLATGSPVREIVRTTNRLGAQAVIVSVANPAHSPSAEKDLQALRSELKSSVALLAGGVLQNVPTGVILIPKLAELRTCLLEIKLRRGA